MIYNTQEELEAGLAKWQEILEVRDWKIDVFLVRPSETEGSFGRSFTNWERRRCTIKISQDTTDFHGEEHDMELTLVHELRHIGMEPFFPTDRDDFRYTLAEQDTDVTARIILKLHRAAAG